MQGFAIWRLKPGSSLQYEQYGFAHVLRDQLESFSQIGEFFTSPSEAGEFLPPSEVAHLQRTALGLEEREHSKAEMSKERSETGLRPAATPIVAA